MAKADKLYSESPSLERNEKGDVEVKKPEKKATKKPEENSEAGDLSIHAKHREMLHRHVQETMSLHHRHMLEREHGKADAGRHAEELKDMHKRHHSEYKSLS